MGIPLQARQRLVIIAYKTEQNVIIVAIMEDWKYPIWKIPDSESAGELSYALNNIDLILISTSDNYTFGHNREMHITVIHIYTEKYKKQFNVEISS